MRHSFYSSFLFKLLIESLIYSNRISDKFKVLSDQDHFESN